MIVLNWSHFEMRRLDLRIDFFYLLRTFYPHLGRFFLCCFFFHYVSAKFHIWPSSGDLLRPRIGILSLVTVSPVITAFHSCCLLHHVNHLKKARCEIGWNKKKQHLRWVLLKLPVKFWGDWPDDVIHPKRTWEQGILWVMWRRWIL